MAESLCYRFCEIDKKKFGVIEDITDKGYYTNSYHINVREPINAFDKFTFESEFQKISTGGCISYVELPNLDNNLLAVEELIKFLYDTIMYAEFNGKSDYCLECDYDGEIKVIPDENGDFIETCGSVHIASKKYKVSMSTVLRHCRDEVSSYRGSYTFRFMGDNFYFDV